jgi:hypothetical protein
MGIEGVLDTVKTSFRISLLQLTIPSMRATICTRKSRGKEDVQMDVTPKKAG